MQTALTSVLLAIALADLFFSQEVKFAPVLLLYLAVKTQADYAAARFLKYGLKNLRWRDPEPYFVNDLEPEVTATPPSPEKPFREAAPLKVISLAEARARKRNQARAEARRKKRESQTRAKEARPEKASPRPKPSPKPAFELPKFTGSPHEVLGVKENAVTGQIVQAFRHWIKRYHPDHAPSEAEKSANEKARQLHLAKEALLEKRRLARRAA